MSIGYSKSAAATPAFALIAEGWNEQVQEGMTPDLRGDCPIAWTSQVLHAEREDGELVGVLCWVHDDVTNAYVVSLGYVEPTSRRRGIFRELFVALQKRATEQNISRLVFQVHADNGVAHDVLKRLGVPTASVAYEAILNP